jgi:hypothetical protein
MPDLSDQNLPLVVTRLVLQSALAVAVAIGGWLLNRAVGTGDLLTAKIEKVGEKLTDLHGGQKLIKNSLEADRIQHAEQFKNITGIVTDHEGRIRYLERPTPPAGAPHN